MILQPYCRNTAWRAIRQGMPEFRDTLILDDKPRITADGYLVASVRAARTGIQLYTGREVDPENAHGMRDKAQVRVYRSEDQVFSNDTVASFTSLPVTIEHPKERITADTWKKYAVGNSGEEVMRDGQAMRIPLIVKDASAIQKINAGKKQISCGYDCDIDWTAGVTHDGLSYDVSQTNIRGNHVAVVDAARAGPEFRIEDAKKMGKKLTVDGHEIELEDAAYILVDGLNKRLATLTTDLATANTKIGTLTAEGSTKDGQIVALTKQVSDAAMTPAKLDQLVKDRAVVANAARKVFPAVVVDGKTDADIRKQVVAHKLTDAVAATMNDDAINGAFATLTAGVTTDTLATAIAGIPQLTASDAKPALDARAAMIADMNKPAAKAA